MKRKRLLAMLRRLLPATMRVRMTLMAAVIALTP